MSPPGRPYCIVTLLTDFGTDDVYVGVTKGVVLGMLPTARVVDLTHAVPLQDSEVASLFLRTSVPYFPHVTVVDPGVGGARRAVAVQTESAWYVASDNGVLTPVLGRAREWRAVQPADTRFDLPEVSSTFNGRDVFTPVAAHLASGVSISEVGLMRRSGTSAA